MFYDLKSISVEPAQRALDKGASVFKMRSGFYSGGHSYNHVLATKRGTSYRVSDWVFKALITKPGTEIKILG